MATRDAQEWDRKYRSDDTPWDSGEPAPQLVELLQRRGELDLPNHAALEVGCGTGDNSVLLAQYGFRVVATDIAETAVQAARDKAETFGAAPMIEFLRHDILEGPPVEAGTIGFAFDRGVFHVVTEDERPRFAERVAEALAPGGWWMSLCGNADDPTEGGPPRLTAAHIAATLEPHFEMHRLLRSRFRRVQDAPASTYLCWVILLRKRAERK